MKNRASVFLKHIASVLCTLVKAKSTAVKSKTNAMKARLIIFNLLTNNKGLLAAISQKIHALLGHHKRETASEEERDPNKAILGYNAMVNDSSSSPYCRELVPVDDNYRDDEYPDLIHSLFDELEFENGIESVIDVVKHSRKQNGATSDFCLEDEIDHVADLFIRRFKRQMQMQKQESFKRYKEMLDRSA